jgi:hypothetical protein
MELETCQGYVRATLRGELSSLDAGQQVIAAVAAASEQRATRLLIDLRGLALTSLPSTIERYNLGSAIADASAGASVLHRLAFVMEPRPLTYHEFAFLVASNRGPRTAGFATETEGVAWLFADTIAR